MNWDGANADTLSVVGALDDAGLLHLASFRYKTSSSFFSRAYCARRACEWVGVDGGAAVDWNCIALFLSELWGGGA